MAQFFKELEHNSNASLPPVTFVFFIFSVCIFSHREIKGMNTSFPFLSRFFLNPSY